MQLNGCERDARNMSAYFKSLGYSVIMLSASGSKDLQPTKSIIQAHFVKISKVTGLTDFGFFFAGHGVKIPDTLGDEADGMDEALVCQHPLGPSKNPGQNDLYRDDDIIADLRANYADKNVNVHVMIDGCHSGSVCDLFYVFSPIIANDSHGYQKSKSEKWRIVCLSAASDSEVALELTTGGLFTNRFLECTRTGPATIKRLIHYFAALKQGTLTKQTPHISGAQPIDESSQFGVNIVETNHCNVKWPMAVSMRDNLYAKTGVRDVNMSDCYECNDASSRLLLTSTVASVATASATSIIGALQTTSDTVANLNYQTTQQKLITWQGIDAIVEIFSKCTLNNDTRLTFIEHIKYLLSDDPAAITADAYDELLATNTPSHSHDLATNLRELCELLDSNHFDVRSKRLLVWSIIGCFATI